MSILSKEEQDVCNRIASMGTASSSRAGALLALNDGMTQAEAAAAVGLSVGQVKYWAAKFRKLGISAFPSEVAPIKAASPIVKNDISENKDKTKKKPAKKNKGKKKKSVKNAGKNTGKKASKKSGKKSVKKSSGKKDKKKEKGKRKKK